MICRRIVFRSKAPDHPNHFIYAYMNSFGDTPPLNYRLEPQPEQLAQRPRYRNRATHCPRGPARSCLTPLQPRGGTVLLMVTKNNPWLRGVSRG